MVAQPRIVDAGICNGRYFLNGVGIGFDGEVVKAMGTKKYFSAGYLAYLLTVARKIFFFEAKHLQVTTSQVIWNGQAFMVTIANGSRYGGGFLVAPQAVVNDGLLDLVIVPEITFLKRIQYLPKVGKGKHLDLTEMSRSARVTIESGQIMAAHLDGELMESARFEIECLAGKYLFKY